VFKKEERDMKMIERLSRKESSGVITLIFVILFIQTVIFLFNTDDKSQFVTFQAEESSLSDIKKSDKREIVDGKRDDNNPNSRGDFEKNREKIGYKRDTQEKGNSHQKRSAIKYELFNFDPNDATTEEFVRLGLTDGQARVIARYRESGGVFRRREDLKKIYVLSEEFYERVKNYIVINNDYKLVKEDPIKQNENSINSNINGSNVGESNVRESNFGESNVRERELTDINRADSVELLSLPGIGPFYASKILDFRSRTGGYLYAGQLLDIPGIDSARYRLFSRYISVDTSFVKKRDITTLTAEELSRNPYIGSYVARAIVRFREISREGGVNLSLLIRNNIIKPELSKILNHYFH